MVEKHCVYKRWVSDDVTCFYPLHQLLGILAGLLAS